MAVDYFLDISSGNIKGECQDKDHSDQLQLLSWSWGGTNASSVAGPGAGSGAGKVSLGDFHVVIMFDTSVPPFFKNLCTGKHIPTGKMTAVKAGSDGKPYLTVTLSEMFITSLQIGASTEHPTVNASFSYNEIKIEYSSQGKDGVVKNSGTTGYNLKENKITA